LKYALNGEEVKKIVKQRLIKIDGKVRTDTTYPAGFMGKIQKVQNVFTNDMFAFYYQACNPGRCTSVSGLPH